MPHRPALRLLAQALDLDTVDQHKLVTAWNTSRSLRESSTRTQHHTGFISAGREHETSVILDAWQRAQQGMPQMVMIGGYSGIGKTTLVRQISDQIAANTGKVMITWGGASSWATHVEPYLAVRTATDRMLVYPESSSTLPGRYGSRPSLSDENIAQVIEAIPPLGGALISERTLRALAEKANPKDQARINALISERSSTDTVGRQEVFVHLLDHLARSFPILMVLEDLHWAGEPTAALLMQLANHLSTTRNLPIMIIGTYRTNEVAAAADNHPLPLARLLSSLGQSSQITDVSLNTTLKPTPGKAFVRGMVEQTPLGSDNQNDEMATWLYKQTSGHPFLTTELLRHLKETRALSQDNGQSQWTFNPDIISPDLPQAISTFIRQRLSKVSTRGQRILELAAVMEDAILTEVIAEVLETDEGEILETIDNELVQVHQLMQTRPPKVLVNGAQVNYRFPHALIREHIYSTLTNQRRKRLHRSVAMVMDSNSQDLDTVALSEVTNHFVMAEDWHSAQMAGYRLAQDASNRLDWDLAMVRFDQAEELALKAQDPHQLWRSRAARLAVLRGLGKFDAGLELGARILQLANNHNWPHTLALANHHMGELHYDLGQVDLAVEHLETAIELHVLNESRDLAAAGEAMLSHATYRQGKYDVARHHAQKSLEYSREMANSWVQPEAVLAAANCEVDLGFYKQAIANYEVAHELAVMIGKLANQFIPMMNIALCHIQMRDFDEAIIVLSSLLDRMKTQRLFRLSSYGYQYLGMAQEGLGNWDAAKNTYEATTHMRREKSNAPILFDSIAGQLRVAVQLRDDAHAKSLLQEITAQLRDFGWEGMEDPLLVKLSVAKANAYFGNHADYRTYIEKAHQLLSERAGMIHDTDALDSYLTNVPVNVELQQRFAALQNGETPGIS